MFYLVKQENDKQVFFVSNRKVSEEYPDTMLFKTLTEAKKAAKTSGKEWNIEQN